MTTSAEFQTPVQVAKHMVKMIPPWCRTALEPTPGKGNIKKALTAAGYEVTAPDDFFLMGSNKFDCVVMNPPFSSKYANLENAPAGLDKKGMRMGYYFLTECMKKSDNIIALLPWGTLLDSDVRMRYLKSWGLKSLTNLPRSTFQYIRVQTVIIELQKGYHGNILFQAYDFKKNQTKILM